MQLGVRRRGWLGFVGLLTFVLLASSVAQIPEGQFFVSGGVKIHYLDQGHGEPVVLIHGFTNSLQVWEQRGFPAALVELGYRVVTLDVRGHGESDKPHDADSYGSHVLADVVRLMDHLGISQSHVVGYSMGGGIALGLLRAYPTRFRSAVVGGMGVITADLMTTWGNESAAELEERYARHSDLARLDFDALVASQQNLADVLVTPDRFPTIEVPLAAVVGADDPNLEQVEHLQKLHPETQVTVLPGYDHRQAPGSDEFRAAVLAFLAKVDGR